MELSIKITTNDKCTVSIQDETPVGNYGYLSSKSVVKNRFQY
jgi:hypothetical protein